MFTVMTCSMVQILLPYPFFYLKRIIIEIQPELVQPNQKYNFLTG